MDKNQNQQRMGDIFRQNRANRRTSSRGNGNTPQNSASSSSSSSSSISIRNDNSSNPERGNISSATATATGGSGGGGNNYRSNRAGRGRGKGRGRLVNPNTISNSYTKRPNFSSLKLEYGKIQSLLDKFGFIYCADRNTPSEIFFHYSESNMPVHMLEIGMEVSFYVAAAQDIGGGGMADNKQEKLSAYSVSIVEQGSVIWETEDEPGKRCRGYIERIIRLNDSTATGTTAEGTIRIEEEEEEEIVDHDDDDEEKVTENQHQGGNNINDNELGEQSEQNPKQHHQQQRTQNPKRKQLIRYTINDYPQFYQTGLSKNDYVEFTIVTPKRSPTIKYARNITMIQTEVQRYEEEKERELMANATYERGIVTALKKGYGFLKSMNRRRTKSRKKGEEEVYFHYSHIELPDVDDKCDTSDDGDNTNKEDNGRDGGQDQEHKDANKEKEQDYTLKEGQEMEFYVVSEKDSSTGRVRISARKVKFLPKGSVTFQQTLATGVTGKIVSCPILGENGGLLLDHRKKNRGSRNCSNAGSKDGTEKDGMVQLNEPITFIPVEESFKESSSASASSVTIEQILLHPKDCPVIERDGREGRRYALWFRQGDTILFDVVRDVVDGSCHVVPTKCRASSITATMDVEKEEGVENNYTVNDDNTTENAEEPDTSSNNDYKEEMEIDTNEIKSDEKENDDNNGSSTIPQVKLVSVAKESRAEGTIVSIKDVFGFIKPSVPGPDIYFRLDEVFPSEIAFDIWKNNKDPNSDEIERTMDVFKSLALSNGTRVSFDFVAQEGKGGGGRDSSRKQDARGERIILEENKKAVPKTLKKSVGDNSCQGIVLMEPSHTSIVNTPIHSTTLHGGDNKKVDGNAAAGRWGNCVKERKSKFDNYINEQEEGLILLLSDPSNVFEGTTATTTTPNRISFKNTAMRSSQQEKGPKRGDLVCFLKAKGNNKAQARDIRILKRNTATTIKGKIQDLNKEEGMASFHGTDDDRIIRIPLSEVISCKIDLLKDGDNVEGIVHEENLVGICRTADLYLSSSIGSGLKERPQLNLTVRKELKGLGGKIIAQSGMAKGPDGTNGFHPGWTTRISKFDDVAVNDDEMNDNDSGKDEEDSNNKNEQSSNNKNMQEETATAAAEENVDTCHDNDGDELQTLQIDFQQVVKVEEESINETEDITEQKRVDASNKDFQ